MATCVPVTPELWDLETGGLLRLVGCQLPGLVTDWSARNNVEGDSRPSEVLLWPQLYTQSTYSRTHTATHMCILTHLRHPTYNPGGYYLCCLSQIIEVQLMNKMLYVFNVHILMILEIITCHKIMSVVL